MLHPHVAAACSPNNSSFPDEEYFSQFILPYDGYLFPFEKNPRQNITPLFGWWMKIRMYLLMLTVAIYVLQKFYVNKHEPFKMRTSPFLWCATLGVFNMFCSWRGFMDLFLIIKNYGFRSSVCSRLRYEFIDVWILLFMLSKFVELGDPYFIVLKKELWVHHGIAAFAVCIVREDFSLGQWLMAINACALSFGYLNWTLRAVNLPVPSYFRKFLHSLVVAETLMFVLWILPYILYTKIMKIPCLMSNETTIGTIVFAIYASYLATHILYDRYLRKLSKK